MITASYIWLIASHLAVLFPLIVAFRCNKRRWLACSIVLFLTSIFSSIYHWHEIPNYEGYTLLGTDYLVHRSLDYFCSYLSIFLVVFYSINPKQKLEHIDISLMIIVIICHIFTVVNPNWYFFCMVVILSCIIYILSSRNTSWYDIIKNLKNNFFIFLFAAICFILGMLMQYYFCLGIAGNIYRVYHGFWHFFMFSSAGIIMYWNEQIRYKSIKISDIPENSIEVQGDLIV